MPADEAAKYCEENKVQRLVENDPELISSWVLKLLMCLLAESATKVGVRLIFKI